MLEGKASGTPVVGWRGDLIYAAHNERGRGYVSVFNAISGDRMALAEAPYEVPFGPLSLVKSGSHEVLHWGDSSGRGHGDVGRAYFMNISSGFEVHAGHEMEGSTVTAPAVSRASTWYGSKSSTVHGWVGEFLSTSMVSSFWNSCRLRILT